ncbi:MAG: class I adenylate-forming enzyme family protein [Actinomycetes bacterium]
MGVDHFGLLADEWAAAWGDRPALIVDDRLWTYAGLAAESHAMAAALQAAGVARGERVPLVDVGGLLAFATVLGAPRIGATASAMNPRLTPDELRTLREMADTSKIAVAGDAYRHNLDGDVIGPDALTGSGDALDETPAEEAVVLFTSGTTGLPKPVPVLTKTLLLRLASYVTSADHQVRLMCVPIHHVGGLIGGLVCLSNGHTLVVQPKFDAGEWLRIVEKHRVALTFLVPTMLGRILDHPDFASADLSSLNVVTYGAAPMPDELIARATQAMPHVGFVNTFGQTETLGGITLSLPDDARHPVHRTSVGKLLPGVEVRVVDPATGTEVPRGDVGELHVLSSQNVIDGWLRTGDLVRIDAEDYVYPAGRLADTINRGGEKFGPIEVETVLRGHPSVRDVAVAGVPDSELNERVGALVVADGVTAEDLLAWCDGRIATYKKPERVVFADEVPLTDIGKVDRKAVLRRIQGE